MAYIMVDEQCDDDSLLVIRCIGFNTLHLMIHPPYFIDSDSCYGIYSLINQNSIQAG